MRGFPVVAANRSKTNTHSAWWRIYTVRTQTGAMGISEARRRSLDARNRYKVLVNRDIKRGGQRIDVLQSHTEVGFNMIFVPDFRIFYDNALYSVSQKK